MSNVATLAGHVTVEDHAVIGGLAAVHQFCRIGKMSMIGGCSKVVQDVPPFMIGRRQSGRDAHHQQGRHWNATAFPRRRRSALRQAYKILFRDGLTIPNALAQIEKELPPLPEVKHLVQFVRTSERGISK